MTQGIVINYGNNTNYRFHILKSYRRMKKEFVMINGVVTVKEYTVNQNA
jgi:hypothetical protein